MYKVYIVEDDKTISTVLMKELETWGVSVSITQDFERVDQEVKEQSPHIILLDIYLPYHNGFYWCEKIRTFSNVPVIFLSSASDNMNMVTAIYQGADDFIAKPFDLNLLVAKLKAMIRRTYEFGTDTSKLHYKDVMLDLEKQTVLSKDQVIDITRNEFLILKVLLEHRGKVVSRHTLMEALWNSEEFVDDNTLTINISRIRKKLDNSGLTHFIQTKKGSGYLIDE